MAPKTSFDVALAAVNRSLGDDADEDLDPGDESVADTDVDDLGVDGDADADDEDPADDGDTDADDASDDADADDAPAGDADADAGDADADDEPDEAAIAAAEAAVRDASTDEFDKLLDELGFKKPKPGQKVNRMPLDRVRARMKTALKKYAGTRDASTTDLTTKLTTAGQRIAEMDRIDALLHETDTKPETAKRYIEMLAAIHPAFKPFLADRPAASGTPTADAEVTAAIAALGAKPGPDVDYKDGTYGYTPEQMEKREQWLESRAGIVAAANAAKSATAALEARFGPMEREYKTAAQMRQDAPRIAARLSSMRSIWGPHFTADEAKGKDGSEILKYQRANKCSFEDATAAVIIPKLVADRTKMRQDILAEFARKRKKVSKSAPQASRRRVPVATGPRTTESVVHAALARHGL